MGSAQTRKVLARHGVPAEMYGVKIGDLKPIAKKLKGNQSLACDLYATGNYDAMYLAGLVADGTLMTKRQLQSWAKGATCGMISDYAVPSVVCESTHAHDLAVKWIDSGRSLIASCGWCTLSGIVALTPDEELDLSELKSLLDRIVNDIDDAADPVRYAMNRFVIAVGTYVKPLLKQAKQTAKALGKVDVEMGETSCQVPLASAAIIKVEKKGRVGKKRRTLKC